MDNLNNIPSKGTFGNAISVINQNFELVSVAIGNVEYSTRKNKGMFASAQELSTAIPNPQSGDWALVGTSFPAAIYVESNGAWANSGQTYAGDNVNLNDYVSKTTFEILSNSAVGAMDAGQPINVQGFNVVSLTQTEYDNLASYADDTLYFIGDNVDIQQWMIQVCTVAEYNALATKDPYTVYMVIPSN